MIAQKLLKELFEYSQDTGEFKWRVSPNNFVKIGQLAGATNTAGYSIISIGNKSYYAHILAWVYVYGAFPKNEIDHRNHIRNANWIDNLREATRCENGKNQSISVKNKSGVTGVCWYKRSKLWSASINVNRKYINLGRYDDFNAAVLTRKVAEFAYGFHPNRGKRL